MKIRVKGWQELTLAKRMILLQQEQEKWAEIWRARGVKL